MNVLVADDDRISRLMLQKILEKWGYTTIPVSNGRDAWEVLNGPKQPRLAVLDWLMPGIEGLELCRRLKGGLGGRIVYTIIVTVKDDKDSVSAALDAGAHDFLSKPFDPNELRSRLAVGVRIVNYDEELHRYTARMEDLAQTRARQIVHADRMATLGLLSAGMAREMAGPCSAISGSIEAMEGLCEEMKVGMAAGGRCTPEEKGNMDRVLAEMPRALSSIHGGSTRILNLARGLGEYCRRSAVAQKRECGVNECVESACELCAGALSQGVLLDKNLAQELPPVNAIGQQLEQVMVNMLTNASEALEGRRKGHISIRTFAEAGRVNIEVSDSGPGIPESALSCIWDPFFTTKKEGGGRGCLGLSISREIVRDHGGEISARNGEGGGAVFLVSLPAAQAPEKGV